jgi:predicted 3-demethylubiquinone-9 3-methyltransferase (glyoxalase superfamily)
MAKNTICLWYDKDAEAAARFYAETFPDSAVGAVHRAPSDWWSTSIPAIGKALMPAHVRYIVEPLQGLAFLPPT